MELERLPSSVKTAGRAQRGQVLLMSALAMAAILGFTAMAIDVGLAYEDRRDLQNDVDAAALAGVQHLPLNPIAAEDAAKTWLLKNGIQDAQITDISVESTLTANDTVRVEVDDDFGWVFAKALGLTTSNIGAQAKARVGSLEGNNNMMPWAILKEDTECLDAITGLALYGQDCVVKVGAGDAITGWYGALDYDGGGGGSNEYEENILDGDVETIYCAEGDFSDPCPGTISVDALSGNKVGGTGSGIDVRMDTGPACDTSGNGEDDFDEVFDTDPSGINSYTVICPDSPNVVVIPIVTTNGAVPVHDVTILGWTLAYLDFYNCASATAVPIGDGDYVFAFDDVRVVASETCEKKAPHNTAMIAPGLDDLFVQGPGAPLPAPGACHKSSHICVTPAPTPTPVPSTPTPTPAPSPGSCNGTGHWEVHITAVDASYSQINGYSGAYDPLNGITIRRLIE